MHDLSVMTSATADYAPGLRWLVRSVKPFGLHVFCCDLGLRPQDRQSIEAEGGITFIEPDFPFTPKDHECYPKPPTFLYCKPSILYRCPTPRAFWLDADLVVTGDLAPLIRRLGAGPVFVTDIGGERSRNHPDLYHLLPSIWDGTVLNSGVVALDMKRDRPVLDRWSHCIAQAHANKDVMRCVRHEDQGCLIWAVESLRLTHRVINDFAWNRFARRDVAYDPENLIEDARRFHPKAHIVHWMGKRKWWWPDSAK